MQTLVCNLRGTLTLLGLGTKAQRETPSFLFFRFVKLLDWDWSELELIFGPLKSFDPSNIRDLQYACSLRIFLRKLQPQVKEWERITII